MAQSSASGKALKQNTIVEALGKTAKMATAAPHTSTASSSRDKLHQAASPEPHKDATTTVSTDPHEDLLARFNVLLTSALRDKIPADHSPIIKRDQRSGPAHSDSRNAGGGHHGLSPRPYTGDS